MIRQEPVSGEVSDEQGNPLPGVSVQVKDANTGVATDMEGRYRLAVSPDAVLVFSLTGYQTQEISINGREVINMTLAPDIQYLDEVVIVGYGAQKKANLTGSVSEIQASQIESKPLTKISQVFAGQITGVSAPQISGEPGEDMADILIRGRGTFSGAGVRPLVLVDGLPQSLENLDPSSIESISVLKDAASASIYGARAANGVILVTTKRGRKGEFTVNYNGYVGSVRPTELPDFVDSWEYAELYNEAAVNSGQQPLYLPEEIQKFRDGSDPDYANADHVGDLFSSGSGFQTSHSVGFSGGTEKTMFFGSFSYLDQEGLVAENRFDRYNFVVNIDQQIKQNLKLTLQMNGVKSESNEPVLPAGSLASRANFSGDVRLLYQAANLLPPTIPARYPDGSYGHIDWISAQAAIDSRSYHREDQAEFAGSAGLEWNILESLKLSGKVGYVNEQYYDKTFNATFTYSEAYKTAPAWLRENIANSRNLTLQSLLEYTGSFNEHSLYLMGGYVQESAQATNQGLSRNDFPSNSTQVINAGSTASMQNSGGESESSLQSFIGRAQYSYRDKYLLEANFRYDGSSRFSRDRRFGFFPSFSGAWRVSDEPFFEAPWLSDLKFRASWGTLGNQNIGNYPYQNTISLGQNAVIGDGIQPGAALTSLANQEITWETTRIADIGADIAAFNGKLVFLVDYFNKKTTDILFNVPVSGVLGFSPPIQNAGAVLNEGWEFEIVHRNKVGELSYSFSPNFSIVRTEVLELPNTDRIISLQSNDYYTIMQVGANIGAFYGYKTDGLFVDQADIDGYAAQPHIAKPGDIRYMDINGPDGVPDGKVDAEYDRTILGSHFPKYTFGGVLNLQYRNFDFAAVLQGVGGVKGILRRWMARPFDDGGTNVQRWQTDRWTTENPNPHARLPRLLLGWNTPNNLSSDYWIIDASYLRLKNVEIGYTFPTKLLERVKVSTFRVYLSASNLFSISDYYEGYDPDMRVSPDARLYPITSTYLLGVNLRF